jgi:hypothetical protein
MNITECPDSEGKTTVYGIRHNCRWHNPSDCEMCKECWIYANDKYDIFMKKINDFIKRENDE